MDLSVQVRILSSSASKETGFHEGWQVVPGDRLITIGEVDDEGLGLACLWTLAGSVVVGLWLRRFSSSGWRTKACGDLVVQWL